MKNISVIDPFGTNYWVKSISYEAMEKQINLTIYPSLTDTNTFDQNQKYSVVWLGINLSYYNNEEIKRLLELLALSEKAVLEHRDDPSSEELWQFILKTLRPKIIKSEAIGDESDQTGHHKGKIYYIEGFNHIYSKLS